MSEITKETKDLMVRCEPRFTDYIRLLSFLEETTQSNVLKKLILDEYERN